MRYQKMIDSVSMFLLKYLKQFSENEDGSAIVEFVLLTLPLFIPLILFLTDYSIVSGREIQYQSLARQAIRAFVTSNSQEEGINDVTFILQKSGVYRNVSVEVSCPENPCFTPNALARLTLSRRAANITPLLGGSNNVIATAYERFDPWISQP